MQTAIWCLLAGVVLPYVWGTVSTGLRIKQFGKIDNANPRAQQAELTGAGARALAAMNNSFEALAVFGPALLIACVAAPHSERIATLAIVWVVARVLHGVVYVANLHPVRSLAFFASFGCSIGLLLVAAGVL